MFSFFQSDTRRRQTTAGLGHRHSRSHRHSHSRKTRKQIEERHKRMNCSPAVEKFAIDDSCYTPKILLQIRDAYNKTHSAEEKIDESEPTKLWKLLNRRIVHCKTEDCWLNQIKDAQLRKRIDRYVFAPDKPYEWKKNPNEWLSNFDIMNVLEQYELTYKEFEFIGPAPIDFDKVLQNRQCVQNELCNFDLSVHMKNGKTQIGVIFNLSPHTSSGSHWVSLYVDMKSRIVFYFDSAGDAIPKEIRALVEKIQAQADELGKPLAFHQNSPKAHQFGNTECGVYSLFFIITMLTGKIKLVKRQHRPLDLKQKLRLFKRGTISDKYIEQYRNVYFND